METQRISCTVRINNTQGRVNSRCLQSTRERDVLRFVDIAFTVVHGGNLVFDMLQTDFGPNNEVSTTNVGNVVVRC